MSGRPTRPPRGVAAALILLATVGAARCGDLLQEPDSGISLAPVLLERVSGEGQVGPAGRALPAPLRVRVVDGQDNPLSRVRVEWTTGPGSGRAEPRNSFTDAEGIAETTWTLGDEAGKQELRASLGSASRIVFQATATP